MGPSIKRLLLARRDSSARATLDRVEFTSSGTPAWLLGLLAPVLLLSIVVLLSQVVGLPSGWVAWGLLLAPALLGPGFALWRSSDRRPALVVDAEGITDRTGLLGRPTHVGWEQVSWIERTAAGALRVELLGPTDEPRTPAAGPNPVRWLTDGRREPPVLRINLSALDHGPAEVVEQVTKRHDDWWGRKIEATRCARPTGAELIE